MTHKAGFVNIIGNPNAGKSTLMNALVGEKLSIITSKAQTTRHRILGIANGEDFQIVYSDTPGILQPNYKMQESMMHFVNTALKDADIFLLVIDPYDKNEIDEAIVAKLQKVAIPVFLIINKMDQFKDEEKLENIKTKWTVLFPKSELIEISALQHLNIDLLFNKILALLPFHPPYYPKDQITDKPERFFIAEIIREKILLLYKQEIPYSVEVITTEFKEDIDIVRIRAEIYVNRKSQKPIIIGKGGEKIKQLGIASREDCEKFLSKKVHLELYVRVKEDWRNDERLLNQFGYN